MSSVRPFRQSARFQRLFEGYPPNRPTYPTNKVRVLLRVSGAFMRHFPTKLQGFWRPRHHFLDPSESSRSSIVVDNYTFTESALGHIQGAPSLDYVYSTWGLLGAETFESLLPEHEFHETCSPIRSRELLRDNVRIKVGPDPATNPMTSKWFNQLLVVVGDRFYVEEVIELFAWMLCTFQRREMGFTTGTNCRIDYTRRLPQLFVDFIYADPFPTEQSWAPLFEDEIIARGFPTVCRSVLKESAQIPRLVVLDIPRSFDSDTGRAEKHRELVARPGYSPTPGCSIPSLLAGSSDLVFWQKHWLYGGRHVLFPGAYGTRYAVDPTAVTKKTEHVVSLLDADIWFGEGSAFSGLYNSSIEALPAKMAIAATARWRDCRHQLDESSNHIRPVCHYLTQYL